MQSVFRQVVARERGLLQAMFAFIACLPFATVAFGQEAEDEAPQAEDVPLEEAPQSDGQDPEMPRSMSGMSILGNEEAPKSLVIIPWKSSQLGDDIDLEDSLDDQAKPVDKDVFLRELRFYEIRSGQ